MNNLMNNLDSIDSVQDLSCDAAATIQGGALEVYTDANFQGNGANFGSAKSNLLAAASGKFHDSISSIKNNTDKTWHFFTDVNFGGDVIAVEPWEAVSFVGGYFNDKISSFKAG